MADIKKGSFCLSTAGRDKGTCYIIVDTLNQIKVSDGRYKMIESPKLKNPKHIELLEYRDEEIDRLIREDKLHNENIKYSIKKYLAHVEK